jgi:hypothetical protein
LTIREIFLSAEGMGVEPIGAVADTVVYRTTGLANAQTLRQKAGEAGFEPANPGVSRVGRFAVCSVQPLRHSPVSQPACRAGAT